MEKMTTWTVLLVMLGVAMVTKQVTPAEEVFPLDMAPSSVDDMYDGCRDEMFPLVEEFEKKERNQYFSAPLNDRDRQNINLNPAERSPHGLTNQQLMAVRTYSLPDIYQEFNDAVRKQKSSYKTQFKYHTLHFLLTTAIQDLKTNTQCLNTFRRTDVSFNQNVLNKEIRFGSFASSSLKNDVRMFGDKSCFQIYTCFGADISAYSGFQDESEVLIPPYEVFKVMKIERKSENSQLPCEVVYSVRSTGKTLSNINCSLIKGKKSKNSNWLKKCMGSSCFGK